MHGELSETQTRAAVVVAREFHDAYERLAPEHGYRTRRASAVPWEDVPLANQALMIHTVWDLMLRGVIQWPLSVCRCKHHGMLNSPCGADSSTIDGYCHRCHPDRFGCVMVGCHQPIPHEHVSSVGASISSADLDPSTCREIEK